MDQNLIFAVRELVDHVRRNGAPLAVRRAADVAMDYVVSDGVEFIDEDEEGQLEPKRGKSIG